MAFAWRNSAVVFSALLVFVSGCATTPAPASRIEPALLSTARSIVAASENLRGLWPGYWPAGQAFILYSPDAGALLMTPGTPPPGFTAVGRSAPNAYFKPGLLENVSEDYVRDFPMGDRTGILMKFDRDKIPLTMEIMFHEAFHSYQATTFGTQYSAGQTADLALFGNQAQYAAEVELERRMLAEAVNASSAEAMRTAAQTYLALRDMRSAKLPPRLAQLERESERVEGVAAFVEHEAVGVVLNEPSRPSAEVTRRLTSNLNDRKSDYPERWLRRRAYGTGAGMALVLDRLGHDWRKRVEQGAFLDHLLAGAIGFDAAQAQPLAEAARERMGLNALVDQMKLALPNVVDTLDEFYALGSRRVTFSFPMAFVDGKSTMDMHTEGDFAQPVRGTILFPAPELVEVELPRARLTISGRPTLQEMQRNGTDTIVRMTVLFDELPTLAEPVLAAGAPETSTQRVRLTGHGFSLTAEGDLAVTVDASGITIVKRD